MKAKEFLTVEEVATLLNYSKRVVYYNINCGNIDAVNLGQRVTRVKRSTLDRLFNRSTFYWKKFSNNSKSIWVASSKSGDTLSSIYHSKNQGKTWEEIDNVPQIGISQINVIERNDAEIIFIGSWKNGIFVLDSGKSKKIKYVDFDVISEILLNNDNDELLIGSWGNGIYNIKLKFLIV